VPPLSPWEIKIFKRSVFMIDIPLGLCPV
jgi:hypothetical protein